MAFGTAQIDSTNWGNRGNAYVQATIAKSDLGTLQAANNAAEIKAALPSPQEADRFDSSKQTNDHTAQQDLVKQFRLKNNL
jgi:hypothetical protein